MRQFFLYIKISAKEYYKIYFPLRNKYHNKKSQSTTCNNYDICSKQVYRQANDSLVLKSCLFQDEKIIIKANQKVKRNPFSKDKGKQEILLH